MKNARPVRTVAFDWEADFWKVAEIAEAMGWPVYKTRRRLLRARVLEKNGRDWMTSKDRLRAGWPSLLDALHRRATTSDTEEQ